LHAEHAWLRAITTSPRDLRRLVEDLRREQELMRQVGATDFTSTYLERTLTDLIDSLAGRGALTKREHKYLLQGLRQPSPEGRRLYARKLAFGATGDLLAQQPPPPTRPRVAAMS
jgi:hypothetical protein